MTDEASLQRLLDGYEIRDLAQRYAVAITSRDLDAVVELFDPDVDNGRFGTGRDGVRAFYANYFERNQRHALLQVGTHQVDLIDATTATGVCFTRSWDVGPEVGPGSPRMDVMVVYFDTYRKQDGRWGFFHRRETLHDIVNGQPASGDGVPGMTKAWEYWDRWRERKASGHLFER
ncbi:MAG TPA: nuclear transport factor 2 family protein [Acidimicrobiia bacterium]|nr:nuclear transport factor 2 family protein [Acidimicrobiia bacterium]